MKPRLRAAGARFQGILSKIRDLEYEVGVPLLTRSVSGVVPTAAGRAFLDHARLTLAQADAAREAARRAAQPGQALLQDGVLARQLWTPYWPKEKS